MKKVKGMQICIIYRKNTGITQKLGIFFGKVIFWKKIVKKNIINTCTQVTF